MAAPGMRRRRFGRADSGSGAVRRGGSSMGSAFGLTADRAIVPVRRYSASVSSLAVDSGRVTPWRGSVSGLALPRVVLLGLPWLGAVRAVDLLEPEQDHGDVVPPAGVVGRGDQLAPGLGERVAALEDLLDARLLDHRGQAVGVEHEHIAGACLVDVDIDVDVRLGAERAGDHGPLRVQLGLLFGQLAALDELADERMIAREAGQLAVAQHVGARVADVGDRDLALADVGRGDGGAHAARLRVGHGTVVDGAVRALDDVAQAVGGRTFGQPGRERLDGHLGRDLAGLRAAHAVGDDEQRRAHEEVVLVALALAAEVRLLPMFRDPQH